MSRTCSRGVHSHARTDQLAQDLQHFSHMRKVVSRTTKRVVGNFPSSKCGMMVPWESQIERDLLYLLEVSRDVESFVAQPKRLSLVIDGTPHTYVPDFYVRGSSNRSWFVEVKPDEESKLPENRLLFAAAAEASLLLNVVYRVVVEIWIRLETYLSNAKLLIRYRDIDPPTDMIIQVTSLLERGAFSLGELRNALGGEQNYQDVMALLLNGLLVADMSSPLSDASRVWLPDQESCL